jgi:hypothetical protein
MSSMRRVLPTAGTVKTGLTIMALALRTGNAISHGLKQGSRSAGVSTDGLMSSAGAAAR